MEIEYLLLTNHCSSKSYYKYVVYVYQIGKESGNSLISHNYDHCGVF